MLDLFNLLKDIFIDIPHSLRLKNEIQKLFISHDIVLHPRTHQNYYIINKQPLVINTTESIYNIKSFSKLIGKKRDALFLVSFWYTLMDDPYIIRKIFNAYYEHQKDYKKHRIIFLLNTLDEYEIFKMNNIPCEFIHQNSLIDENIFKPLSVEKKYNLIYNGRIEPFKRHYLLKNCSSIGLISTYIHNMDKKKEAYLERVKECIPDAELVNFRNNKKLTQFYLKNNIPLLSPTEVCKKINQARVGVILSAKEGACYASVEYLLSGLPVVSTINYGGRNEFLDNRYCRIVPSRPKAVQNAVNELIAENYDPNFIRQETIKKMIPHKNRLKNILYKVINRNRKIYSNPDDLWKNVFRNKMIKYAQPFPQEFIKEINS